MRISPTIKKNSIISNKNFEQVLIDLERDYVFLKKKYNHLFSSSKSPSKSNLNL